MTGYEKKMIGQITSADDIIFENNGNLNPKLTIIQQVEHMKKQGILFDIVSEEEAISFLENNNYYFKIKAYKKAYYKDKNIGKYIDLDFAYLKELSTVDALFRKIIVKITLDIEHFLKVRLLTDCLNNSLEDGYFIVKKFLEYKPNCKTEIVNKRNNPFIKNLIKSINDNYSIWNIVELLSFGDLSDLIHTYYYVYPDRNMKKIVSCLFSVRCIRNAAAHNNCLLNNILQSNASLIEPSRTLLNEVAKIKTISSKVREKKMENAVLHDFTAMLFVFDQIVTSDKVKQYTYEELKNTLVARMYKNINYFFRNADVLSYFDFLKKVIDFYTESSI
ncbi:Abi family protein [Massilimaliae timonensis]|uniref:Abi family protein n=1 Tax=Massiliimalia timonensis TaxID=1987501 RepID=A0A8J6P9E9_9FIRM|nr:Abi family protein [Massiliimalia timonensis]MBC8611744.1 Abi family protein [Massiliimalia timonensis]